MRLQWFQVTKAVSAVNVLVTMCCWGCSVSEYAVAWDLKREEMPKHLAEIGSLRDVSIDIVSPMLWVMTDAEQEEIIEALKVDTRRFEGDDSFTSDAMYRIYYQLCLFRGPAALIIGLDDFGFGFGEHDEFRFTNRSLARVVEKVFRRNVAIDPNEEEYYKEIFAKCAGDTIELSVEEYFKEVFAKSAGDTGTGKGSVVVASGKPRSRTRSDLAVECIASFVGGAEKGMILARMQMRSGMKLWIELRGSDSEVLTKSLVDDSWPSQGDEKCANAPGGKESLQITFTAGAYFAVIWLDQSGFHFGKDGQYRFDNPSLARDIEQLLLDNNTFDGSGDAARYKAMLAAAAGKARPQGAARLAAEAARERGKARVKNQYQQAESRGERGK